MSISPCLIICRKLTKEERSSVQEAADSGAQVWTSDAADIPNARELPRLSVEETRELHDRLVKSFLAFPASASLHQGVPLIEKLQIGSTNTWFYYRFRVFVNLQASIALSARINKVREGQPIKLYLSGHEALRPLLGKDVEVVAEPAAGRDSLGIVHYLLFLFFRVLQGFYQRLHFGRVRKIVLESRQLYRKMLRSDGNGFSTQHAFTGYLQEQLPADFGTVNTVLLPSFVKNAPFRLSKIHFKGVYPHPSLNEEYIHFRAIARPSFWKRFRESKKQSAANLETLRALEVHGLQDAMRQMLISYHKSVSYFLFKHIAWSYWLKDKEIDVLSGIDEYSVNTRIIFEAAHAQNIRTVALQHGNFHDLHPGYRYGSAETAQLFFEMVVWGDAWADFLQEKAGMKKEQLHVSGPLRTDVIPVLQEKKSSLRAAVNLPEDKQLIMYASQPLRDDALRWQAASDVFRAVANLQNVHLIFKPHPREQDYQYYHQLAEEAGCSNYSLHMEEDLYLLLAISELVIVLFSTVGQEATYFHKDLIIYDPDGLDQAGYHQEGVAFTCKDSMQLKEEIASILAGEKSIEPVQRAAYIRRFARAIDGKSASRILAVLSP